MVERSRITLGSPMPMTPQKRGGVLQDLLVQFGSQSSAEAATKTRRTSSQRAARPKTTALRHQGPPTNDTTSQTSATSEDELAPSARPARRTNPSAHAYAQELKMEKRNKERQRPGDSLRRSTRARKSTILESDTVPAPTQTQKLPTPLRKLDSARNRLRGDIARKSKAKANDFLVAHKDYFLPLLPRNNQVSKLAASHDAKPIVEYEELIEQPKGVTAVMKPYQLSGLSYLVHLYNNGFSGILGDEMGLGKTLQTLSLFQYLEELDQKNRVTSEELRPYLVVCPLSVLNSWVGEAQRWVPGLRVMRFHGAMGERQRLKRVAVGMEDMKGNETTRARHRKASRKAGVKLGKLSTADHDATSPKIIVTTYETFQAEQAWFKHSFVWRYVVLDEGHKIKSSVTQISTALRNISAEYRLILTGTPLQNNLVEMWSLLAWLYPDVFIDGTDKLFKESFDLNKGKVNRETMDNARRLLELIMLRRMKDSPSVSLGLPPKEEVLLYVPLTPMQKFWYMRILTRIDDGMLDELFADGKEKERAAIEQDAQEEELARQVEPLEHGAITNKSQGQWEETANIMRDAVAKEQTSTTTKGAWLKLMNLVMQLRKCCSHPYLLPGAAPDPYYLGDHIIRASGKFILLEKLLKHTILEQGKKVLLFSGFTRTLDYCEDLLSLVSNFGERFRSLRLDGSTARARRNLDIRLFNQQESDYKVMLLSTRAGGLGINLTSAQVVIFLDEDWNPQITLQAEARAHRIGQTKKVTIYKLCTQGTVEEQMMGRIRKKLYLSAKITESMQNLHSKEIPAKAKTKTRGRPSQADDMPQMDTSQLKTLVRRGAQTLSHPEINANEMVSWDLETMMTKCRDKPADTINSELSHSEVEEDKWLSVMERVECAVFDGKRYQRQLASSFKANTSAANILPDNITREDRRKGKNTTVIVSGYAISKESLNCGDWEAVPTMAGKDPRLADPVRDKRRNFNHEEHCLSCFEDLDDGYMVECRSCPRTYHFDCLESEYQSKVKGFSGFFCPQHNCSDCGKSTTDAGGLIFRCRWCPLGYCEDCLEWDQTELIGDNLVEFELLGEEPTAGGFYIKCPVCIKACEESEEQKNWVNSMETGYKEQHGIWLQHREKTQRQFEQHGAAITKLYDATTLDNRHTLNTNGHLPQPPSLPSKQQAYSVTDDDDDEVPSPPAMTDTSLPTPALSGSRVTTPKYTEPPPVMKAGRKRINANEGGVASREEKRARLAT